MICFYACAIRILVRKKCRFFGSKPCFTRPLAKKSPNVLGSNMAQNVGNCMKFDICRNQKNRSSEFGAIGYFLQKSQKSRFF